LIVVDLIAGTARKVSISGGSDQPAWSPDGQRIAYRGFAIVGPFQKESGMWVVPASGGAPRQIWTSDLAAGSGASTLYGWTDDGTGVVIAKGSAPASVVDVATGKITPLGGVLQAIASRAKHPSVALVFNDQESTPRAALAGHVEVRDTILAAPRTVGRYGSGDGTFFSASSWNPRSDDILVTYACGQGVTCRDELVIVGGADGTRRSLRTATTPRSAAWSADGARILYSDLTSLRVVNADGSNDHELFRPPGVVQQFVTGVTAFAPR
jgi:Tol biopolymer transport system component